MENCLLIGNGLNRTLEASISWGDLLKDVAEDFGVDYYEDIPMPQEFERIINSYLKASNNPTSNVYEDIKKKIAEKIKYTKLPDGAIHNKLRNLPVDAIMTTNYDYLLEYVFNGSYIHKGDIGKKYLDESTSIQKGIKFFHVHGMIASPKSICLGYEHYAGLVERLRSSLNKKENNENSKMMIKQILCNEKDLLNTWGEKFYISNIAILGLGLTSCEIDLWWLITHRAYLYYSNYCGLKSHITNRIVFFDIIDDLEDINIEKQSAKHRTILEKKNLHRLLENSHIEVKKYFLSDYQTYKEAYTQIIKDIGHFFASNNKAPFIQESQYGM